MSHEGKQGGKRKGAPALVLSKKDKKARKEIATMVINDLKSTLGNIKKTKSITKDDEGDNDNLYNLVRGNKSAMVIQRMDKDGEDFVPTKQGRFSKVVMMISSDESEDGEYKPKCSPKEEGLKDKNPDFNPKDKSDNKSSKSSEGKVEVVPSRNEDAFPSSSSDQKPGPHPSSALRPRLGYSKEEKFEFYKEQQERKYDSIKKLTQDVEVQFDDLSTYIEQVEKRHRLQDEREAANIKLLEERQQTREKREREYKEKDRIHEERIKVLEADRKEIERGNDLMKEARNRIARPVTRQEAQILTLEEEIRALEERRTQRWRELIVGNQWDDHEQDPEVISIVNSLDIKRKVKAQMEMWFTMEKMKEKNKPPSIRPPSAAQEWGQANGPLAPDPNFASTPWHRFR
jgi:hypothetical protein